MATSLKERIWQLALDGDAAALAQQLQLLEEKSDLNFTKQFRGVMGTPLMGTPLMVAAFVGHEEVVKLLLDAGADVNYVAEKEGSTALLWASSAGHVSVVKALLEKGAHVEAQNVVSDTALLAASYGGHVEVVRLLLAASVNPDLPNTYGMTALIWASDRGHLEVVRLLLAAGADPDRQDKYGKTALIWASERGHLQVMQLLLEAGADLNLQDKEWGQTVLSWACREGHQEVVRLLLEAGANPDIQDQYGQTALIRASEEGHLEVVRLLLEAGANPDKPEGYGNTALMLASRQGHQEVVRLLLEAGADLNLRNNHGQHGRSAAKTPELRQAMNTHVHRPHPYKLLMKICDTLLTQFSPMLPLHSAIRRRDELQRELNALRAAGTGFCQIAAAGKALKAAIAAVEELSLSEEAYLTLAARRAALVQRVTARCGELVSAQEYDALETLAAKLEELQAQEMSTLSNGAVPPQMQLAKECDTLLAQFAHVAAIQNAARRQKELQRELIALKAVGTDFRAIAAAGKALKAAIAAVEEQSLSDETYLTLVDRHAALVQRVTARCRELASAEEYDALDTLAAKLEELKALDVSSLSLSEREPASASATTFAGLNDAGKAPGAAVGEGDGTGQAAVVADPVLQRPLNTVGVTEVVHEEEWAHDPVYVPSTESAVV